MKKENITLFVLKTLLKSDAFDFIVLIVANIFSCLVPLICTKLLSDIVTIFSNYNANGNKNIFKITILYISLNLGLQIIIPIREYFHQKFHDKISADSELMLFKKIKTFKSIECFENSNFYNMLLLAKNGAGIRFISITDMFTSVLSGIITVIVSSVYLVKVQWLIASIAILSILPATIYNFWAAKNQLSLFRSKSESSRKLEYFGKLFTEPTYSKEMRLFNLGEYIIEKYKDLFDSEFARINKGRQKYTNIGIMCTAISAIISGLALFLYVYESVSQKIEVGSIVLYISLLPQFVNGIRSVINGIIMTKTNNSYVKHFVDFLNIPVEEKIDNQTITTLGKIQFNKVSFKYPNSNEYALKNISFECDSPKLIAIVGENGSGKSTLVKLLLKFFKPESGNIYINDTDLQDINTDDYRHNISGVFQSPAKFAFSVKENIKISDIKKEIPDEMIVDSCKAANAHDFITKLPHSYESILGKQFSDGTEISDGQWQKLSLARALCADASMLIFDEASADLDPKAEYLFFENIKAYAKNKMTIYITHRLSGTKDADLIIVLDHGQLVEKGTHEELMSKNGIYKKLFSMQANGYTEMI